MNARSAVLARCAVVVAACVAVTVAAAASPPPGFVENLGQWDAQARYHMLVGQTAGDPPCRAEVWLTEGGYVYALQNLPRRPGDNVAGHAVALRFVGARTPAIEPGELQPGSRNWLVNSKPVTGARSYGQVIYRGLYPGIDLTFDAATPARAMETTWRVAPGADPGVIAFLVDGADAVRLDAGGNLLLETRLGDIAELHPVAFQTGASGERRSVTVAFALEGSRLRFAVGEYDRARPLVIDPVVAFSRTYGGSNLESVASMHEDATGRYLTGTTYSSNFPATVGAYDTVLGASYYDWFALKFNAANDTLLWATFIGGASYEYGGQSALRSDGQLVIAGSTYAPDTSGFPDDYSYGSTSGGFNIGVFRLSADGATKVSAACFGGSYTSYQYGSGVAVNPSTGDVYVTGQTYGPQSSGWPWGGGGFSTAATGMADPFVARLNADFSSFLNSTMVPADSYYYDTGMYLAIDSTGNVYVSGLTYTYSAWAGTATIGPAGNYDLFIAKYSADLMTQYYDTRIGGTSTDPTAGYSMTSLPDYFYQTTGGGLVVDGSGQAWATGMTASTDWPTTAGAYRETNAGNYDAFVLALNATGTALAYGTMIGGSSTDAGRGIARDAAGNVYVVGLAASTNYPTTLGAPQGESAGSYDWVLSVFSPDLSRLLFSTHWGGTGSDFGEAIVLGPDYRAQVAGITSSSAAFPQVPPLSPHFGTAGNYDGGVASFDLRADLLVTKTTDGVAWLITVANAGVAPAAFASGQRILVDNLPTATYAVPAVINAVNVTNSANISCSVVGYDLTCSAVGATVTVNGGGSFQVRLPFETADSALTNPRAGGSLRVDPDDHIDDPAPANDTAAPADWRNPVIPALGPLGVALLAAVLAAAALLALRRRGV